MSVNPPIISTYILTVAHLQVFGNSNSLPISLVLSLSQTIKGLHWDRVPGDNDDEVAARGILYLLIFQQLGQLLRWSWGYHVLLAPPAQFKDDDDHIRSEAEQGRVPYRDEPASDGEEDRLLGTACQTDGVAEDSTGQTKISMSPTLSKADLSGSQTESAFDSGGHTPVTQQQYTSSVSSKAPSIKAQQVFQSPGRALTNPTNGNGLARASSNGHIISFPNIASPSPSPERSRSEASEGFLMGTRSAIAKSWHELSARLSSLSSWIMRRLPKRMQDALGKIATGVRRFLLGLWDFMNPPLWAMLAAIIVASIPSLQRMFFTRGTFIQNSVTSAIRQSGGVAVPLILVVLGANLARNTLPNDPHRIEDETLNRKLLIASIVSRMLLPIIVMAPLLALAAKYVPVSILDDPIFVIVCFSTLR